MINRASIDKVIKLFERVLGLKISDEKKDILRYNFQTRTLINAIAGSGKTTTLELSALMKIATGQLEPQQILGITFSRKARLDMQTKYRSMTSRIKALSPLIEARQAPKFTTFHALFLHLLAKVQTVKVLPSYTRLNRILYPALKSESKVESDTDILRHIFRLRALMIDDQYSFNGLSDTSGQPYNLIALNKIASSKLAFTISDKFCLNYVSVIKTYEQYKQKHHLIDFADMETHLLKSLNSPKKKKVIKKAMLKYKFGFIDEFQDINQLQWVIISKILSKHAKDHLAVVGDDDQSIYYFRGSMPSIIINYKRNYPQTKVFHLSTNYRTGGNILHSVAPLIESNHYRLRKRLSASHKGVGKVIEYIAHGNQPSGKYLFKNLYRKIKDPEIPNSQIAVLCRYNLDKTLITDRLADKGIFVSSSQRNILQDDRVYRTYIELMKGVCNDDFSLIEHHLGQIGFRYYRQHVSNVKESGSKPIKQLSDYLKLAKPYDEKNRQAIINSFAYGQDLINHDEQLKDIYYNLHNQLARTGLTPEQVFDSIDDLVSNYYQFMTSKKFISQPKYSEIHKYLKAKLADARSLPKYFKLEHYKHERLEASLHSRSIALNVITLHQSKGLQFKYVYLYNLTDQDVKDYMVRQNDLFPPNIRRDKFIEIMQNLDQNDLKKLGLQPLEVSIRKAVDGTARLQKRPKALSQLFRNQLSLSPKASQRDVDINHIFNQVYDKVINTSYHVEEERRLVYVGMTRAEKAVYINVESNFSPLLKELTIPAKDQIIIDKHGRIHSQRQVDDKYGVDNQTLKLLINNFKN